MTTKAVTIEEEFSNGFFDAAAFTHQTLSSKSSLAAVFEHTLLKPEATRDQVVRLCEDAAQHGFACAWSIRHGSARPAPCWLEQVSLSAPSSDSLSALLFPSPSARKPSNLSSSARTTSTWC